MWWRSVALCSVTVLLLDCRSPANPATESSARATETTGATNSPTQPAARELVTITLHTRGGPELGPGLTEYQSVTVLDERTGDAKCRTAKSASEQPYPIGAIEAQISAETFTQVATFVRSINWGLIPPASAGGPGTTAMRLITRLGTNVHKLAFISKDIKILEPIEGLLEAITNTENVLYSAPLGALRASASFSKTNTGVVFHLEIANIGTETIWLAHPLSLTGELDAQWAGIKAAPIDANRPLAHTLQWQYLPVTWALEPTATDLSLHRSSGLGARRLGAATYVHATNCRPVASSASPLVRARSSVHGHPNCAIVPSVSHADTTESHCLACPGSEAHAAQHEHHAVRETPARRIA